MPMLSPLIRWTYKHVFRPAARNSLNLTLLLTERDRPPAPIESFGARSVLVLAPHMDDEVIGCGGVLALHAAADARVSVAYMTDGRWGDADLFSSNHPPDALARRQQELRATRRVEAQRAARIIGIAETHFLDAPDGALAPRPDVVRALARLLALTEPELVYLPFAMDLHEDHWQTNRVFVSAAAGLAPSVRERMTCRGYEVWTPLPANRVADITAVIGLKRAALREFRSQLKDNDYMRCVEALNAYRSMAVWRGRGYAEAYHETTLAAYEDLVRRVTM